MSDRAVLREVAEELGIANVRVSRLIWIVENHFIYRNRRCHEVGFYYGVELPTDVIPLCTVEFTECEPGALFSWFPLSDIASVDIRPRFLSARLSALPDTLEHLQIDEIDPDLDRR